MNTVEHLTLEQLEAGLEHIRQSPKDVGTLKLISRRPNTDEREVLTEGQLDQLDVYLTELQSKGTLT